MKLRIKTHVRNHYLQVKDSFDERLFLALNPPFPIVKLLTFDGCSKGDMVSLELDFLVFKQIWTSEIVSDSISESMFLFIDEGRKLPFFLKSWSHKHYILNDGPNASQIIDEVDFNTPWFLPAIILYPMLYLQFLYRRPIYKRILSIK